MEHSVLPSISVAELRGTELNFRILCMQYNRAFMYICFIDWSSDVDILFLFGRAFLLCIQVEGGTK